MATKVADAIGEIDQELTDLRPKREGWEDFGRENVIDQVRPFIAARHAAFEQRITLLQSARAALQAVLDDGYPGIPVAHMNVTSYQSLVDQLNTMEAALSTVDGEALADFGLQDGGTIAK